MNGAAAETPAPVADRGRTLAEVILAETRRAGLDAGGRLPTERQLAEDFGVSRTSVRRALDVLEAGGHISREVGRGTFLRDPHAIGPGILGPASDDGESTMAGGFAPADVMAIRRLVEPPAMRLVVAWASAADFREIDRCLAGCEQAARYDDFELWDLALHRAIVAAAHSPLLTRLYGVIEDARHGRFWGDLKRRTTSPERQQLYQADHRELVSALRVRDADRAAEAMRAHLSRVGSALLGATD